MELVVFDGTSAFIINETDLVEYPNIEVLGKYNSIDEADIACEKWNYQIDMGLII